MKHSLTARRAAIEQAFFAASIVAAGALLQSTPVTATESGKPQPVIDKTAAALTKLPADEGNAQPTRLEGPGLNRVLT